MHQSKVSIIQTQRFVGFSFEDCEMLKLDFTLRL
jgi:hypothetical protein